jgi:hypothetical protein
MISGLFLRRSSLLAGLILGAAFPLAAPAQLISQAQPISQAQKITQAKNFSQVEKISEVQASSQAQLRAANLARMEAERLNGGLNHYVASQCMHQRAGASCLIQANASGFLFRFPGGTPGWEANRRAASVETQILISADGKTIEKVIYNGLPRSQ